MKETKVLITEDEFIVAEDLRSTLMDLHYSVVGVADSAADSVTLAKRTKPDLVLMDIKLRGEGDGISAAERIRKELDIPVIFLTGHADAATVSRAGSSFPFGYVVKPFAEQGLRASIEMALQLHAAQDKLQRTERWLATTLQSIGDGVISVDLDGCITFLNSKAEQITGWPLAQARGRHIHEVFCLCHGGAGEPAPDPVGRALQANCAVTLPQTALLRLPDGREIPVEDCAAPIRDASGATSGVVLVFRDATARRQAEAERQQMERRLQRRQRLEGLGTLAGGIAHDFNNLLAAILANAQLGRCSVSQDSPVQGRLQEIEVMSLRAAELCRQMLWYAGMAGQNLGEFSLNRLVDETVDLLRASISKKTTLHRFLGRDLPLLKGDPSQIRQVIMNLVVNASEALEGKDGSVLIRTALVWADRACLDGCVEGQALPEGDYVLLEVRDTGCGMTPETLARIFDPFFSTKFAGRGLGLATVYGIIQGHRGALQVQSVVGQGSVFTLFLPISGPTLATPEAPANRETGSWRGSGRALLVDDEPPIRKAFAEMLTELGFDVMEATDGLDALKKLAEAESAFRVVLLDLTMPHLDGVETLEQMRGTHADLPVLLMTGFSEEVASSALKGLRVAAVLLKPFTLCELRDKLAAVLGQPAS